MKHIKRCMAVALLAIGLAPMQGLAATTTATMNVALQFINSVATLSTTPINFGALLSTVNNASASGTITANVSNGTTYKISINAGLHATTRGCRRLVGGTRTRDYDLLTQNNNFFWGDSDLANSCPGLNGSGTSITFIGTGVDQAHVINARVKKSLGTLDAGVMSDTLTVTLSY